MQCVYLFQSTTFQKLLYDLEGGRDEMREGGRDGGGRKGWGREEGMREGGRDGGGRKGWGREEGMREGGRDEGDMQEEG